MNAWELIVARSFWTYAKGEYDKDPSDANFALLDHAASQLARVVGAIVSMARIERQTNREMSFRP